MQVRNSLPTVATASSKKSSEGAGRLSPKAAQAFEDTVTFTGIAGASAGIAALSAVLAPEGAGVKHVIQTLAYGAGAGVGGAFLGSAAGEFVGNKAEQWAGTSHSGDERLGNTLGGMLTGAVAGAGAGLASGFFGVSPLTTAAVAGGGVLALGVAAFALSAFDR